MARFGALAGFGFVPPVRIAGDVHESGHVAFHKGFQGGETDANDGDVHFDSAGRKKGVWKLVTEHGLEGGKRLPT